MRVVGRRCEIKAEVAALTNIVEDQKMKIDQESYSIEVDKEVSPVFANERGRLSGDN